jgi:hypothetical protein
MAFFSTKINQNCPHFKIGNCNNKDCLYMHHKACYKKLECDDPDCKFGHICSWEKRMIAIDICENYYVPNWQDTKYEDRCKFYMNCTSLGCGKQHVVEKKHRLNICKIISNENSDTQAENLYNELYYEKSFSPIEQPSPVLSSMSTVSNVDKYSIKSNTPTPTPTTTPVPTMVDLFKNKVFSPIKNEIVPVVEVSNENSKTDILKNMINIEKNIDSTQSEIKILEEEIEEKMKLLNIKKEEKENLKKKQAKYLQDYQELN